MLKRRLGQIVSRRWKVSAPLLALLVCACASGRGGPVPYDVQDFGRPDVETVAPLTVESRISPADEISVTVFGVQDLSGEHRVDPNGFINMPLIGQVQAAGKSSLQLSSELQDKLGQRYLRNPNVQVSIKKLAEQTVTVDGAVNIPGVFPIRGNTTLQQAVALGKGLSGDANLRRVVVFRQINGKRHAAAFDLQAIRSAQAADPIVYGNDIVIVDRSTGERWYGRILSSIPLLGIFNPF